MNHDDFDIGPTCEESEGYAPTVDELAESVDDGASVCREILAASADSFLTLGVF